MAKKKDSAGRAGQPLPSSAVATSAAGKAGLDADAGTNVPPTSASPSQLPSADADPSSSPPTSSTSTFGNPPSALVGTAVRSSSSSSITTTSSSSSQSSSSTSMMASTPASTPSNAPPVQYTIMQRSFADMSVGRSAGSGSPRSGSGAATDAATAAAPSSVRTGAARNGSDSKSSKSGNESTIEDWETSEPIPVAIPPEPTPLLTPSVSTNVEVIGSALKSDYVAPIRILKRDPQKKPSTTSRSSSSSTDSPNSISSDDGRKATPPLDGGASRSSSSESVSSGAGPAKTLAEREAEYRVARMRIFGKEDSEDSAGSTGAANDASSSGVSSSASAATGATAEGLPSRPGSTVSAVSRADTSRPRTPPEYSRRVNSVESQRVGSRGGAVLDAGGDVRTLTGYNRMPTGPPTNGGGWMGLGGSMSGGSGIGGGLGGGIAGSSLSGVGNGGMAIGVGQVGGGLGAGGPTWGNNSSFGAYLGAVPYSSGYPGLGGVGGFGAIPGNMSPYVPSGMPSAGNQTLSFQNGSSHGGNNTVGAYPPGSAPLPPSQLAGVGGAFRHNSSFSTPAGYSSPQLQQHVPPQSQSPGNPPHQQRYGLHPPHAFPHQQQQQQLGLLSQSHGFNPNTVPGGVRYSHPGSYHPYSGAGGGGPIMPLGPHPGHHHQQPGRYTQNNGNIGVGSGFNSAKTNFSSSNNGGSSSPGGFGGGHRSMYERSAGSSSSTTSTTSSYASTSSLISPRPQDEVVSGLPYGVSAGGGAMGSIGAVGAMGGGGGIVSTSTPLTYDRLTGGFVAYKGAAGRSTGPAAINGPGGGGSSGGGGGGGGGGNPAGRGTESAGV